VCVCIYIYIYIHCGENCTIQQCWICCYWSTLVGLYDNNPWTLEGLVMWFECTHTIGFRVRKYWYGNVITKSCFTSFTRNRMKRPPLHLINRMQIALLRGNNEGNTQSSPPTGYHMHAVRGCSLQCQLHSAFLHVVWVVNYERLILYGMARLQDPDGKDGLQIR